MQLFLIAHFSFNSYNADSLNIQITGSFRKNEPLKSFSSLQIISNASNFGTDLPLRIC